MLALLNVRQLIAVGCASSKLLCAKLAKRHINSLEFKDKYKERIITNSKRYASSSSSAKNEEPKLANNKQDDITQEGGDDASSKGPHEEANKKHFSTHETYDYLKGHRQMSSASVAYAGLSEQQQIAEDLLCNNFQDADGNVSIDEFYDAIATTGLDYKTDTRLRESYKALQALRGKSNRQVCREEFKTAIQPNMMLLNRALTGQLVIPDWREFCKKLEDIFVQCKANQEGTVASYIPTLARCNPHYWALSVCTVDGQRMSLGDYKQPFTVQSVSKPVNYAIALNELGQLTHEYVSQEPSGKLFNDLSLKIFEEGRRPKPHNPMVNSGAIVICSLLMHLIHPEMTSSEKFDFICNNYKQMIGDEYFSFSTATFLAERETADRNYAIAYYLRENKCFPKDINLQAVMDLYFQLCSLEVTTNALSKIACVFASGGLTYDERRCVDSLSVRHVLSLCHSCGMYDYSGQFAFDVGLPAKSGVSGCTILIIPNVAGIALYSPRLDSYGNSVRSLSFARALVESFNLHQYDNMRNLPHKFDPRRSKYETLGLNIIRLLFAASRGDLSAIRRYYMSGLDMSLTDYDNRSALHAAAAEGHKDIVEYLLRKCHLPSHEPRDRWGRRPIDDAKYSGHAKVADFLSKWPEQIAKLASDTNETKVPFKTPPSSGDSKQDAGSRAESSPLMSSELKQQAPVTDTKTTNRQQVPIDGKEYK